MIMEVPMTAGNPQPTGELPPSHKDYMTLGETAEMLDLLGGATAEDIERAGTYRRPSPRLGRLIVEHAIEIVIVSADDGKCVRAISPYDVNRLFDVLNPREA